MSRVPILRIADVLVVTVNGDIDDATVTLLGDDLAAATRRAAARGVLIDVSALDVVDSFVARALGDVARTVSAMGADAVVTGLRPAVAMTLVEMGVTIPGTRSALNAERGLAMFGITVARDGAAPAHGPRGDGGGDPWPRRP